MENCSFICAPQLQKDDSREVLPADDSSTTAALISFPSLALEFFPNVAVNDLNSMTNVDVYPMNVPANENALVIDDIPFLDHQSFSSPSSGVDTMNSGYQTHNSMTTSNHEMDRAPPYDNVAGAFDRNPINTNTRGVGNMHMRVQDAESQYISRQPTDMYRNFTKFSGSAARVEQDIVPNVYNNQIRFNSSQPNRLDKLDGRFLSLGYQSNIASNVSSNTHGGTASHMSETSFSSQGNPTYSGEGTLKFMTPGSDMSPISNRSLGQMDIHHFVPTPRGRTSESEIKSDSRMYSSDPAVFHGANPRMVSNFSGTDQGLAEYMKRRMQEVSFKSTVLRSFHQNAVEPLQKSNFSNNLLLPPVRIGESGSQDKTGLALGTNTTSFSVQAVEGDLSHKSSRLLPVGKKYPPYTVHGCGSAGHTVDVTVKNELHQASTAGKRESLKRKPLQASMQDQRRKIMPQISVQQFSPDLLQNALGQNTSTNSSFIPSSSQKEFTASGWTRNTQSFSPVGNTTGASNTVRVSKNPAASTADFVNSVHIPATCSASKEVSLVFPRSMMNFPPAPTKTSATPVASSLMNVPPTSLARTVVSGSGSARSLNPATNSNRVAAAAISSSACNLAYVTALRKASLLNASPDMTHPFLSDWRKSSPSLAALAKAAPGFRALQVPSSHHHLKFQGFDIPPTVGFQCLLCKRDLSFAPEGPFVQPSNPPAVAVLPCGHTFHDQCLLNITPEDQSKGPPCIPCAMGVK